MNKEEIITEATIPTARKVFVRDSNHNSISRDTSQKQFRNRTLSS